MKSEDIDGIMIVVAATIVLAAILIIHFSDSINGRCTCKEKRCATCGKVVEE